MPISDKFIEKIENPFETETIKIKDIIEETNTAYGGWDLPLVVEFLRKNKTTIRENSTSTWNPKKPKFYVKSGEKGDYVTFSGEHAIYALKLILKLESFSELNEVIGKTLEAVVVATDKPFIDWTKTLRVNGVVIPTLEELGFEKKDNTNIVEQTFGIANETQKAVKNSQKVSADESINDDELPF
jgi:hypothetical protein